MSDLVNRLRATAFDKDNFPRMKQEKWFPVGLALEAADEIEELQRRKHASDEALILANGIIDRLRAKVSS